MGNKAVIITVDTEGDNLWDWSPGKKIETNNSKYIKPFQNLCEKYGFIPVYLVNYEMAMSDEFVTFVKDCAERGKCEIGMHLHAWNSPPEYKLENAVYSGNPYITEYPLDVIREKHRFLKSIIEERTGFSPVSYRSGRWATSDELFQVLGELGFLIDCSITPGINHKAVGTTVSHANNYKNFPRNPYQITNSLWEIPMTTNMKRTLNGPNLKRKLINGIRGEQRWLRPALHTSDEMLRLINDEDNRGCAYFMVMIHSSELMPGGSPYCKTQDDIEHFLNKLEIVFQKLGEKGKGYSLKEYYNLQIKINE